MPLSPMQIPSMPKRIELPSNHFRQNWISRTTTRRLIAIEFALTNRKSNTSMRIMFLQSKNKNKLLVLAAVYCLCMFNDVRYLIRVAQNEATFRMSVYRHPGIWASESHEQRYDCKERVPLPRNTRASTVLRPGWSCRRVVMTVSIQFTTQLPSM